MQPDPYQPTDVATFNQAAVPSLNFTTGAHLDYHKPSDTADKINYEDLDRIAEFATAIAARLMEADQAPQFVKVEQSSQTVNRTGVRVFTGTVPDYAAEAKGLLLGGVIGGGPAEQAGLQKGDVIVEIAGQTIANIYDYTYALELLKIGEAGEGRLHARLGAARDDADAEREEIGRAVTVALLRHVPIDLGDDLIVGRRIFFGFLRQESVSAGPCEPCADERHDEDHHDETERQPPRNLESDEVGIVEVLAGSSLIPTHAMMMKAPSTSGG